MASGPALGVSRTLLRRTRGCFETVLKQDSGADGHRAGETFKQQGWVPGRRKEALATLSGAPLSWLFESQPSWSVHSTWLPLKSRNKPTLSLRTPRTRQRVINAPPSSAADPGRASFSMLVAINLRPKDDNLCGSHALMGAAVRLSNLDLDIWEQQHHREQQHRASRRAWDEGRVGEGWAE